VLRVAIALMAVAALVWLGYQFWRLIWGEAPIWPTSRPGAVDLKYQHELVHGWFAGRPVYRELPTAVYPPASAVLLWPLLGWLSVGPARWLWAVTTVIALLVLIHLLVRASRAERPLERVFVALIPCSIYPTGAAIGNGQIIVYLLPMLLVGLLMLRGEARGWRQDLIASGLLLAALVKPQVTAPFLWLALVAPRPWRPLLLVGIGYCILTVFAASFQETPLGELLREWHVLSAAVAVKGGYGNVANLHVWLGDLGLKEWILPASLLVWLGLGVWVHRHRGIDLWILLGITAIVARFYAYHRWYDDVLLLLPMVALFRIVKREPSSAVAGVLLGAALVLTMAPGGLFLLPPPWNAAYLSSQTILWLGTLVYLLGRGSLELARR
jgi:hypothetical protein